MRVGLHLKKNGELIALIAAICFFIAPVLLLNAYNAKKLNDDSVAINVSERQSMLSQKMLKILLEIKNNSHNAMSLNNAIADLNAAAQLFNATNNAFLSSGYTLDTRNNRALIDAIEKPKGKSLVDRIDNLWVPFFTQLEIFLNIANNPNSIIFQNSLANAIAAGSQYNVGILDATLQLKNYLQTSSNQALTQTKNTQMLLGSFALIAFLIIFFYFSKKTNVLRKKVTLEERQSLEIINRIKTGLVLLDKDLKMKSLNSPELSRIFERDDFNESPFQSLFINSLSEKGIADAESYIRSIFTRDTAQTVNPLSKIEIITFTEDNDSVRKVIHFDFSQDVLSTDNPSILVTVTDITEQMAREKNSQIEQHSKKQQVSLLLNITQNNRELLDTYIQDSLNTFNVVSEILTPLLNNKGQYTDRSRRMLTLVHDFKNRSDTLHLDHFSKLALQFQNKITELLNKVSLTSHDFFILENQLDILKSQMENYKILLQEVMNLNPAPKADKLLSSRAKCFNSDHFEQLAKDMAKTQYKAIELIHSGLNDYDFSEAFLDLINTLSTQLIENAITHGIEPIQERTESNKKMVGMINIRLTKRSNGYFEFSFRDDGRGLDLNKILSVAIQKKLVTPKIAETMTRKDIVSLIFSPALSTHKEIGSEKKPGLGMASIKKLITEAKGRISVGFKPGVGTTFTISLPLESVIQAKPVYIHQNK